MGIGLRCLKCNARYLFEYSNTKIYGPVIHTVCPSCNKKTRMNLSKFSLQQIDTSNLTKFEIVRRVSAYIAEMEKERW